MKSLLLVMVVGCLAGNSWADIPRTLSGHPYLSGNFNTGTLTPLQRPKAFGNNLYMTREKATELANAQKAMIEKLFGGDSLDPDRKAPPKGGDGNFAFGAGGVGGYNSFWIDRGEGSFELDGQIRTSIIYQPENGRLPPLLPAAQKRLTARYALFGADNQQGAWWLDREGPGPFDGPESRTMSDRCLQGFGSTGGPPMLPTLYNNYKRIIQSEDHVMILVEMVHDVRTVRLNSEHISQDIRLWMGDSIGYWEEDTLVVDTTNFTDRPGYGRGSRDLQVIERFSRIDGDHVRYQFTVSDPSSWQGSWSGEYTWSQTPDPVYEYACHEGNYAMEGILRGGRLLEAEHRAEEPAVSLGM